MSVETSRYGFQLEVSRTGLVQLAERLVFPNRSRRHHADGGLVPAGIASLRRVARGVAFRYRLSLDGCDSRDTRVHSRTRIRLARLANFTDATDLSADAELCDLESNFPRAQRRLGQLGKTRTHCERSRSRLTSRQAGQELFLGPNGACASYALLDRFRISAVTNVARAFDRRAQRFRRSYFRIRCAHERNLNILRLQRFRVQIPRPARLARSDYPLCQPESHRTHHPIR